MTNMSIDLNRRDNLRPHTPNEIIRVAKMLVTDMGDLVKLWDRRIEMASQLEKDAGCLAAGSPDFHDKAMATLEHIIRDLDSREKTVSWHSQLTHVFAYFVHSVDP